jgi:hypothetical protein
VGGEREMMAKPISIKLTGGKSGGCASKAVELTSEDLRHGDDAVFAVSPKAAVTTNTLTASPNPSNQGDTVTFTATVTPAPPDGELITFEMIGQAPLSGSKAVFQTSTLPVGKTKVRAIYFANLNSYRSRSVWMTQIVK